MTNESPLKQTKQSTVFTLGEGFFFFDDALKKETCFVQRGELDIPGDDREAFPQAC